MGSGHAKIFYKNKGYSTINGNFIIVYNQVTFNKSELVRKCKDKERNLPGK